jgi:hypothetical protein
MSYRAHRLRVLERKIVWNKQYGYQMEAARLEKKLDRLLNPQPKGKKKGDLWPFVR